MSVRGRRFRFGDFELDLDARELRRDGRPVRIQPQPYRVLELLVLRAGEVVSRDELRQRIWDAATFVEFDQGLNYCIRQIRFVLGDSAAHPAFVETLKKRGYRFTAPVNTIDEAPGHVGGAAIDLPRPEPASEIEPQIAQEILPAAPRVHFIHYAVIGAVVVAIAAAVAMTRQASGTHGSVAYGQLTSFSDAAFEPALSPDGRMLAFLVGNDTGFPFSAEVFTKMLPDGEPIQRTHDSVLKYGVAFSSDGSEITYTAADAAHGWTVRSLPVLGGDSRLLLSNAAGLSWLDEHHALFSQIKTGLHMQLVTATDRRENLRSVYLPQHERAMAHYGRLSPDGQSVLVVEMGPTGGWVRCRLVPFDGSSTGMPIGPDGPCLSAAWSPDGRWMYFTAVINGASHVWRQRFPSGEPEQLTSGPAQVGGIAVSPDGRSIVTSLGIPESGVWLHSTEGERLISPDGYASQLSFSPDGRFLYFGLRHAVSDMSRELWMTDLTSGMSEPLVQGFFITSYDVSPDGAWIVFGVRPPSGPSEIWIASRNHATPPKRLTSAGEDSPSFGVGGDIVFRQSDGHNNYLFVMAADATRRRRVMPGPILELRGMSADRTSVLVSVPVEQTQKMDEFAVPIAGGPLRRICPAICGVGWSADGGRMYVRPLGVTDTVVVMPVPKGGSFPALPPAGVASIADASTVPGSEVVHLNRYGTELSNAVLAFGLTTDTFAYARTVSHRNLFRVELP
jgi:DNA-binding winged helix-turn-helix (wHTH) protein/Tol biopolymer transport system component